MYIYISLPDLSNIPQRVHEPQARLRAVHEGIWYSFWGEMGSFRSRTDHRMDRLFFTFNAPWVIFSIARSFWLKTFCDEFAKMELQLMFQSNTGGKWFEKCHVWCVDRWQYMKTKYDHFGMIYDMGWYSMAHPLCLLCEGWNETSNCLLDMLLFHTWPDW